MAETRPVAPGCVEVVVKESVTRFSAFSLHPAESCERIERGARTAVERVTAGAIAPPPIEFPARLDVEMHTADMAEVASWVKGVERLDTRTVRVAGADGAHMYRSFVALTYITRQTGGR